MPRRAKRARGPRVAGRGLGWLWPAQPCGLPYDKFRSGLTFKEAYEWLAYRANARGETFRPSQKRIVSAMATLKHEMYDEYVRGCELERGGGKPAKTWADCRRVCKIKSRPCGKACVSKKRNCKKPPAPTTCSIEEFQTNLSLDQAAEEAWEERRAAGAALPEEGDTSFDFTVEPKAPFPPADDDIDFGYEPPTRYGFNGLRGGRGGAAANRGRYKPLPPGQSAIDQVRALEKARGDIIRAIESGAYELCPKGTPARAAAPAPQTYGNRTASEIEAVRRRMEKAGW